MRFRDIANEWFNEHSKYIKESSSSTYRSILNRMLPYFGDYVNITEDDAQEYIHARLSSGCSVKAVQDDMIVIKMILKFGGKRKWCDAPIDWKLQYPTRKKDSKLLEVFSDKDYEKFIKFLMEDFNFQNLGLLIVAQSGIRIGEMCGLRWGDIDVVEKIFRVERTVERIYCPSDDETKPRTKITIGSTKTLSSNREIPLTRDVLHFVRPLIKVCNPNNYILSNSPNPVEPRTYRNYYYGVLEKLGIPKIKFHGIRHTFATGLISSKCDVKTVSCILGHSNISTTLNTYVHPDAQQKRDAIDSFFNKKRKSQ